VSAVLVFTAGLAVLSWRYIERPFRSSTQIGKKPMWAASAAGALVLLAIGWVGYSQRGFVEHYAPEDRYLLDSSAVVAYIPMRARSLWDKEFEQNGKRKIVLVGDSFAEDLTNAVYESGLSEQIQLSTHHIGAQCGNLFLKEDFSAYVPEANRARCGDGYDNPRLQRALREADEVWLSSSWHPWQAELLPKSVANLKAAYSKPVLVFGRKDFGNMVKRDWIGRTKAERLAMTNTLRAEHVATNALMRATLPADRFIDISALMCRNETTCPLFTDADKLVSYDGSHLTVDGAKYLGELLRKNPLIMLSTRAKNSTQ
jgi:hypothetical protein